MRDIPEFIKNRFWIEKSWIDGLPIDIEIPEIPVFELVDKACEKFSDRTAMIFYGREIKYGELKDAIDRFATALADLGVKKGDKVALYMPNCPQFAIAYYGAMKSGAIVTALSPLFVAREVEYQLNDSESETIVTIDALYPNVAEAKDKTRLKNVIVANLQGRKPEVEKNDGVYYFDELLDTEPNPPDISIDPKEELAVLQYTGGTTGLPKAAMLTHYNVVANVYQTKAFLDIMKEREGIDVVKGIAVLPWYHIYGQTVDLTSGLANGNVGIVFARFDPVEIMEAIQKYKAHVLMGAPALFVALVNHPDIKKYDLSSLKYVNNGAGPIAPEVVRKWEKLTGTKLVEGYGLSETSPVTNTTSPYRERKIGSVGPPIPNTYVAVIDPETLEFLPIGEIGEIVISGPQVMKGYWKRPKETEEVFFEAGGMKWLRTGDIGYMDEDGYLWIVDRLKDLIKYKGHSVYPREIEDIMYEHPAIKEVVVVGVPDPKAGETIKAYVVLEDGYVGKVSEQDIIDWCRERMAAYKYPRIVEFRDSLPKSAAGKYLRRVLRDEEIKKMKNEQV
jgi:long-chain acyl-CoA synthetase